MLTVEVGRSGHIHNTIYVTARPKRIYGIIGCRAITNKESKGDSMAWSPTNCKNEVVLHSDGI